MSAPARGPLLRTSRLTRTAALALGTLALGTAAAPAAWADDAPASTTAATPTTSAPSTSAQSTPEVLAPALTDAVPTTTDAPGTTSAAPTTAAGTSTSTSVPAVAASTSSTTGAHFGTGKLALGLTSDTLPTGRTLDPTGAQLELRFSQVGGQPSTVGGTCEFGPTGCTFQAGSTVPGQPVGGFGPVVPSLPANSVFTLTLVRQPTSGQLLAAGAPVSIQGYTDTTPAGSSSFPTGFTSDLRLPVSHGYRTLGVALTGDAPLAGAGFELCPATAGACTTGSSPVAATTDATGLATFTGAYLPGDYLVRQTSGPAGTATPSAAARPFSVPAATTVADRDAALRLTVAGPTTAPPTTAAPTTATVASATLAPGRQQTVTLSGFTPGETVRGTLYSTPVDLGTVVADARGVATFSSPCPPGWSSASTPSPPPAWPAA